MRGGMPQETLSRRERKGRKKKKKGMNPGGRGPIQGAGLVRASRPGNLPPTDTDSNPLVPTIENGATLSYLDSWPA